MIYTFECLTEKDMEDLGRKVVSACSPNTVISLRGSLGAGKTVFARGAARELGIEEAIVSPTFTLIQEYEGKMHLYHMDLYRITSVEDFQMTGGEDMLYAGGICLIEWSEVIDEILPRDTVFVEIKINEDKSRTVTVKGNIEI